MSSGLATRISSAQKQTTPQSRHHWKTLKLYNSSYLSGHFDPHACTTVYERAGKQSQAACFLMSPIVIYLIIYILYYVSPLLKKKREITNIKKKKTKRNFFSLYVDLVSYWRINTLGQVVQSTRRETGKSEGKIKGEKHFKCAHTSSEDAGFNWRTCWWHYINQVRIHEEKGLLFVSSIYQ